MAVSSSNPKKEKPGWLRVRMPTGIAQQQYEQIRTMTKNRRIHTICVEAKCPNINECWGCGTATFLLMGDICTRYCRFCNTKSAYTGIPMQELVNEPKNLATAVGEMQLRYVVLTSVDRDDLPDGGAQHFANCISEVKTAHPGVIVEVLVPDFNGSEACIKKVAGAGPDVLGHNLETVRELQENVRDLRANYAQSLKVLATVKKLAPHIFTKSALMLGLGESDKQIEQAMDDLRTINCDILAIGQYLQPGKKQLPVQEYVTPEKFGYWRSVAEKKGFLFVASGPFVRSSYKAGEFFARNVLMKRKSGGEKS